jgi:hypothetical protein
MAEKKTERQIPLFLACSLTFGALCSHFFFFVGGNNLYKKGRAMLATLNTAGQDNGKRKRKHSGGEEHESPKKMKNKAIGDGNGDDEEDEGGDAESYPRGNPSDSVSSDLESSLADITADISGSNYQCDSENEAFGDDGNSSDDVSSDDVDETIEMLAKTIIRDSRDLLAEGQKGQKDAIETLAILEKNQMSAQMEQNAFCSLKRSEVRLHNGDFFFFKNSEMNLAIF